MGSLCVEYSVFGALLSPFCIGQLHRCYPDRSGEISRHWQRLRPWVLCSGDPSATLRMTDLGAIASRYNIAVLGRYIAVIPTAVEGSHDIGRDSDLGFSVQEILRLRSG